MVSLPTSKNGRRALYRNLMIGAIGVLGALAFVSRTYGVEVHTWTTALLAPILALAALQFGALDEMAKQAHYAAWYWGAFIALIAIGAIAISLSNGLLPFAPIAALTARWLGGGDDKTIFIAGMAAGPVLMLAGYLIWSAIHWLRMR